MAAPPPTTQNAALNHASLLSTGGEVKKDDAIRLYLASQARFSKVHAAEGRAVLASWDENENPPSHTPWPSAFETPVLKARVAVNLSKSSTNITPMASIMPEAVRQLPESRIQDATSRSDQIHTAKKPSRTGLPYDEQAASRRAKTKRPVPQADDATCDSDEEYTRRLAERREQKRLRRAVLKPKSNGSHSDENSSPKKKAKKSRKKSPKATPKIPAGLALMHGFASTSVGKNRLTLVPPTRSSGVFNRGKASTKFSVDKRKRSRGKDTANFFSERHFLNNVSTEFSRRRKRSPSPSPSLSSHSRSDIPEESGETSAKRHGRNAAKKRKLAEREVKSKKETEKTDTSRSPSPSNSAPFSTDRPSLGKVAESVVWDIERESCTLPSESGVSVAGGERSKVTAAVLQVKGRLSGLIQGHASNISAAKSCDTHPSITQLDFNQEIPVLHAQLERSVSVGPSGSTAAFIVDSKKRSSSLGPSESASQVIACALQKQDLATSSKYFLGSNPVHENIREDPMPRNDANKTDQEAVLATPDAATLSVCRAERSLNDRPESPKARILSAPSVIPSSLDSLKQALHAFENFDPSLRNPRKHAEPCAPNAGQNYDEDTGYVTPRFKPTASFGHGSKRSTAVSSALLYMEDYSPPDALDALNDGYSLLGDPLGYTEPSDCVTCDPLALGFEGSMEEYCIYQPNHVDRMDCSDYVDPLDDMQPASEGYQDSSIYWDDDVLSTVQVQADGYDLMVLGSELDVSVRDYGYSRAFSAEGSEVRFMSAEPESMQSPYCASSDHIHIHDHTDSDGESLSFEEPWFSQSATLLRAQGGLIGRARSPLERNLPTVARVEQDVARTLRDHWHPQKL